MRYHTRVKSRSLVILALAIATVPVAAQRVLAQPVEWSSHLPAATRARVGDAIAVIDRTHEGARQARRKREELLEELYAIAREEALGPGEYADMLREHGVGESALAGTQEEARETIATVFRDDPPLPGTPAASAAGDWLRSLAARELFPVGELDALVRAVESAYLFEATTVEARGLLESVAAVAGSPYEPPDGLSDHDRAGERLALWTLEVLAAGPYERVALLRRFGQEVVEARDRAHALADEYADALALCERLMPKIEVIAVVSPHLFADPERHPPARDALEALGEFLVSLTECGTAAGEPSAELTFLVDTTRALLLHASDLQRYRLAVAMGVARSSLDSILLRLYQFQADRAALPSRMVAMRAQTPPPGGEYHRFLSDGRSLIEAAQPWADGERSRSGDSFRWAMLPIVSHPYAQYLLATDPALESTAAVVSTFVSRTHSAAIRRAGPSVASLVTVSSGDGVLPFHRVYRVPDEAAASALYEAYAAEAQGVDELSGDFRRPYAAGLTMAGYWSHLHGLHLLPEASSDDLAGDFAGGPAPEVRAQVAPWIALAQAAETPVETLSLLVRGLVSLRRVVLHEIAGAAPSIALRAPRLSIALALLDQHARFEADPAEVFELLALLYEVAPGEDVSYRIGSEVARVVARLRNETADRKVLVAAMVNEATR